MSDRPAASRWRRSPAPAWLVGGAVRDRLLGRADRRLRRGPSTVAARARRARSRARRGRLVLRAVGGVRGVARRRPTTAPGRSTCCRSAATRSRRTWPARPHDQRDRRAARPATATSTPSAGCEDLRAPAAADGLARRVRARPAAHAAAGAAWPASSGFAVDADDAGAARARRAGARRRRAPSGCSPSCRRIVRRRRRAGRAGADGRARRRPRPSCPSSRALRGVEQSQYHHLDVYEHTRAVLARAIALERDPRARWPATARRRVARVLAEPLANELTRGQALRFGALLHDIAKPQTRDVTPRGPGHVHGPRRGGARRSRARCSAACGPASGCASTSPR